MKDTILHCIRVNEGTELAIKSGSDAQYTTVRLFFRTSGYTENEKSITQPVCVFLPYNLNYLIN